MELTINNEFYNLIPPLSLEELRSLEASLKHEGCRDPLVVWNNTIIDGHHRYAICNKYGISFDVVEKTGLETELDVKLWMVNNQFSRRNLPTETRLALAYRFKELEAQKAKERQLANLKQFFEKEETAETSYSTDRLPVTLRDNTENNKTLEVIAQKAGVGYSTAFQYDAIQRKGTDEQKAEVAEGKSSIKKVYTKIQKAERLEKNKAIEWPKGKYRVIYADPPWQYGDERSGFGGAIDHYNTMTMEELKAMPVASLSEDNAVLFLWCTAPLLPEAVELINAWGFKYKTNIVWDKVRANLGNYTSVRHEHLFIATKGSGVPDNMTRVDSVQVVERVGRHSEKPEEFRNIIESLYTYGNKLEMFARKQVDGWEVFGNEL
jgi:N6-adenosine-specific RNA methylase IME4